MNDSLRSRDGKAAIVWGIGFLLLAMLVWVLYRSYSRNVQLESVWGNLAQESRIVSDMKTGILKAVEAEKNAVMADAEESRVFAEQSRAAVAAVDESRKKLQALMEARRPLEESDLVREFDACWTEFKKVNKTLLDYAVQSTNLKATHLSITDARDALRRFESNLSVVIELTARSQAGQAIAQAAFTALSAAFEIYFLETPHIIASSDEKMDEIESAMTGGKVRVENSLQKIRELLGTTDRAPLDAAVAAFSDFVKINEQIITLSRQNTNVRSMELSLGAERNITAHCEEILDSILTISRNRVYKATR